MTQTTPQKKVPAWKKSYDQPLVMGQTRYYAAPMNVFGQLFLDYKEYTITKINKKTARIKTNNNSHETPADIAVIQKTFTSKTDLVVALHSMIKEAIPLAEKELEGYTKKHLDYSEFVDKRDFLKKLLLFLKEKPLTIATVEAFNKEWQEHLDTRAKYKVGDKVYFKDYYGEIQEGVIEDLHVFVSKKNYLEEEERAFYRVSNKKERWSRSSVAENKLSLEKPI